MDMPEVCQSHVLYTDVDVVFANQITQTDIQLLTQFVGQGMLSYGREFWKGSQIQNTGVMVSHVERFERELPSILQTARDTVPYPVHDQALFNEYKRANHNTKKFQMLPMQYNWRVYWGEIPIPMWTTWRTCFYNPDYEVQNHPNDSGYRRVHTHTHTHTHTHKHSNN